LIIFYNFFFISIFIFFINFFIEQEHFLLLEGLTLVRC